ncbi:MAG: LamG domain-containing protein, partial [Planctomycetota bacterium]
MYVYRKPILLICFILAMVLSNTAEAVDPDLLLWLKFDEASGTVAFDHSSYGNDATLTGGAQRVPGKMDKAIDVDGSNGMGVEIAFTSGWPAGNPPEMSVAMWVKPHVIDASDDDTIFFMHETGSYGKLRMRINNGNWQNREGNGTSNINSTGPAAILNEWTHYVGMRRDNDALYLYINGQFADDSAFGVAGPLDPSRCWIGAGDDGLSNANNAFDGLIDDVQVYTRVLTEEEIQAIMIGVTYEATEPNPLDLAVDVPIDANLTWTRGDGALQDYVYFGTDPCQANLLQVDTLQVGVDDPLYDPPGDLIPSTTYYWYITEVNAPNEYPGPLWS